jgi:hypothetical protein
MGDIVCPVSNGASYKAAEKIIGKDMTQVMTSPEATWMSNLWYFRSPRQFIMKTDMDTRVILWGESRRD